MIRRDKETLSMQRKNCLSINGFCRLAIYTMRQGRYTYNLTNKPHETKLEVYVACNKEGPGQIRSPSIHKTIWIVNDYWLLSVYSAR